MKLLNDFYKIISIQSNNDKIFVKVRMNSEHTIYKVHFPNNPITPGVCLVQMAMELLQTTNGQLLQLSGASKIRYRNIVKPCDEPQFEFCNPVKDEDEYRVCVKINSDDKICVQMTLNYKI